MGQNIPPQKSGREYKRFQATWVWQPMNAYIRTDAVTVLALRLYRVGIYKII